ncbi:MAG: hypothetical protein ACXW3U_16755, partial [Rhodoplanes sp.]
GHGSAHVYESTPQSDARGAEDLREDRDPGVGTFEAHAEERGNSGETLAVDGEEPGQDRDRGRVVAFEVKAEEHGENVLDRNIDALNDVGQLATAGGPVDAWQQRVVGFYGMRLRKNVELGRSLAEVEGIADFVGLQRKYVSDMLLDYASSFCGLYGFSLRGAQQTTQHLSR